MINKSILVGMIAETSMKASLLKTALKDSPERVEEITDQIEVLELEMISHLEKLEELYP